MNWFKPALMAAALISLIAYSTNIQGIDPALSCLVIEAESCMGVHPHRFVIDAAINDDNVFSRNHSIRECDVIRRGAGISPFHVIFVSVERFWEDNSSNGPIVLAKTGIRTVDNDLFCIHRKVPTLVGSDSDIHINVNEECGRFAEVPIVDQRRNFASNCGAVRKCGLSRTEPSTLLYDQGIPSGVRNSLCRLGLLNCCCDNLISLRGGRPHFIKLSLSDADTVFRNIEGGESDKGRNSAGDSGNPLRKIQIWKYPATALLGVLSFILMLLAYFWLLFAVAVPKGVKFGWWFDRFNVHLWSPGRRGMVALAFFLISVALIITAVRLVLPHHDLPSPHPLIQISSIRTV